MIARLQILLPFTFSISVDEELPSYELKVPGYSVRVHAPYKSEVDRSVLEADSPVPITHITEQLGRAEPQPRTSGILLDGSETTQADVLRIDFVKGQFERRQGTDDPPIELGFRIANELLARLRTLGRARQVKAVQPDSTVWGFEYLNDDESELESSEGLCRARNGLSWRWDVFGLRPDLWAAVQALPDSFQATSWDSLLLDARGLLPEVGPAIVLAFAAIETRIEVALDLLAPAAGLNDELWEWIKRRGGDYRKEPSVSEQIDHLLHSLSGRRLKEDDRLWEAFRNLREARNTFVHEGRAMIGGVPVTSERAGQLVAVTGEIIDWIEQLLPEGERRPRYERETDRAIQLTKVLVGSADRARQEDDPMEDEKS